MYYVVLPLEPRKRGIVEENGNQLDFIKATYFNKTNVGVVDVVQASCLRSAFSESTSALSLGRWPLWQKDAQLAVY